MVPESVSLVAIETVSLPDSCRLPLLTRVEAVKFLPLMSSVAPESIVSVPEMPVFFARETSELEIWRCLNFRVLFVSQDIVCADDPLKITFPVPASKFFQEFRVQSPPTEILLL